MTISTDPVLALGGDAVARVQDGRVVFIRGAAPSERVSIEIVKENKSFLRAELLEVLSPSRARVEPVCSYFGVCGGCVLQHVDPVEQTRSKDEALRETLRRIGKVDLTDVELAPPWSGDPYRYRSRARFAINRQAVGYRQQKSNRLIDVESCPILSAPVADALSHLRQVERSHLRGTIEVSVVANEQRALTSLPRGLKAVPGLNILRSDNLLRADDNLGTLYLSPLAFAQANPQGNGALVSCLSSLIPAGSKQAIELYSGSGNLTRVLCQKLDRVVAIEGEPQAHRLAKRAHHKNVTLVQGAVEDALDSEHGDLDLLVLDPPRTGASPRVIEQIGQLRPKTILYVSCDLGTLSRDLHRLSAHGFALDWVKLFDCYPQTPHVEVVARLRL